MFNPRFNARTSAFTAIISFESHVLLADTADRDGEFHLAVVNYPHVEGLSKNEVTQKLRDEYGHTIFSPLTRAVRLAHRGSSQSPSMAMSSNVWDYLSVEQDSTGTVFGRECLLFWLQIRPKSSRFPSYLVWRPRGDDDIQASSSTTSTPPSLDFGPNLSYSTSVEEETLRQFVVPVWSRYATGRSSKGCRTGPRDEWRMRIEPMPAPTYGNTKSIPWWTTVEAVMCRVPLQDNMKLIAMGAGVKPEDCDAHLTAMYGKRMTMVEEDAVTGIVAELMCGACMLIPKTDSTTGRPFYGITREDYGTLRFTNLQRDDAEKERKIIKDISMAAMDATRVTRQIIDDKPIHDKRKLDQALITAIEVEFNSLTLDQRAAKLHKV